MEPSDVHDPLDDLQERLGIRFHRRELLVQALTHRSLQPEMEGKHANERLEFLGDAVLALITTEGLYRSHPDWPEGELTKMKAAIVSEGSLELLALEWQLGAEVRISRGEESSGGRKRRALLADTVEAVIGAYFLDHGYDACRDFVLRESALILQAIESQQHARDYKTLFHEAFQARYQIAPSYQVINETGPAHDRTFEVAIIFNGQVLGRGEGKSKKSAEQQAAAEALLVLETDEQDGG